MRHEYHFFLEAVKVILFFALLEFSTDKKKKLPEQTGEMCLGPRGTARDVYRMRRLNKA